MATTCERLDYTAARWGLHSDVVVRLTGPAGPGAGARPRPRRPARSEWAVAGVGVARVTVDRRGCPTTVLDDLGETWTVATVTGVWMQLGQVPADAVRAAWRVRVVCWHTPAPAAAVTEVLGDGSWRLRPPR